MYWRRLRFVTEEQVCHQVEQEGSLTIITINRPDSANALHPEASWQLAEAFDQFAADPKQWVAILTANGDNAFCAGTDLNYRAKHGRQRLPESGFGGLSKRFDLDKPVVAAVNSAALGGGFELALACDIIIASDRARFGLTEVVHGQAALGGGIHRLARSSSLRVATELILTGREISAEEALQFGIVNDVVAHSELMDEARRWAQLLLAAAPLAVRASKETLLRGLDEPSLAAAISRQDDYPAVRRMRASNDAKEGIQAFVEKRKPDWSGD
jgi:enoyl-CoA hydratase/carnithine racemase